MHECYMSLLYRGGCEDNMFPYSTSVKSSEISVLKNKKNMYLSTIS